MLLPLLLLQQVLVVEESGIPGIGNFSRERERQENMLIFKNLAIFCIYVARLEIKRIKENKNYKNKEREE